MKTLIQSFMGTFLVTLFFFSSCSKSSSGGGGSTSPTDSLVADVYVSGYEFNGTVYVAKLWKNGVATNLSDGKKNAAATGVCVKGADVYVSFTDNQGGAVPIAKVWKSGTVITLGNGIDPSWTGGVHEGVIVGTKQNNGSFKNAAGYWSGDGTFKEVTNSSAQNSQGNGIYIRRINNFTRTSVCGNVNVSSGLASTNAFFTGSQFSDPSFNNIGQLNTNSFGKACFINDNGFTYIAGTQVVPTLWLEGSPSISLSNTTGTANGLFVIGFTNIYAVGYELINGKPVGKLWKGDTRGTIQNITITNTQFNGNLNAIQVVDGNEFIAGEEADASGFYTAKYWKNGKAVVLGGSNSIATGIWVVKK